VLNLTDKAIMTGCEKLRDMRNGRWEGVSSLRPPVLVEVRCESDYALAVFRAAMAAS
jgi:hypothetical protein